MCVGAWHVQVKGCAYLQRQALSTRLHAQISSSAHTSTDLPLLLGCTHPPPPPISNTPQKTHPLTGGSSHCYAPAAASNPARALLLLAACRWPMLLHPQLHQGWKCSAIRCACWCACMHVHVCWPACHMLKPIVMHAGCWHTAPDMH